ncbi:MAG: DUF928 domain-containing protein [Cyanobacteria bacterium RI_101]|nr:DUF928 domain-containing protein [Cyanobacteria bacterium RI_101]
MRRLLLLPLFPLLLLLSAPSVHAQPANSKIRFPKAQNRGAPPVTTGAGVRGETCLLGDTLLFSLRPSTTAPTVAPNPTILVYLPEHRAKTGILSVIDGEGREVYQAEVALPEAQAILAIPLPATASLQLNQIYGWRFTLSCPSKVVVGRTLKEDFTEVNLKRVSSNLPSALPALERAQAYADQGLWLDVLATLAPLREQEPETWRAALDYLQFGEFADSKIVFLSIPPQRMFNKGQSAP